MKYASFEHFFTTLGNKQRVKILQLLSSEGPMSVNAICSSLGCEQSATSHNLKQLLTCHFVTSSPSGKERIYSINQDTVEPLLEQIDRHVTKYCVKSCEHTDKKEKRS